MIIFIAHISQKLISAILKAKQNYLYSSFLLLFLAIYLLLFLVPLLSYIKIHFQNAKSPSIYFYFSVTSLPHISI